MLKGSKASGYRTNLNVAATTVLCFWLRGYGFRELKVQTAYLQRLGNGLACSGHRHWGWR